MKIQLKRKGTLPSCDLSISLSLCLKLPEVHIICMNSKGSGNTVWMSRLV